MIIKLGILALLAFLFVSNPNLSDFTAYARQELKAQQSLTDSSSSLVMKLPLLRRLQTTMEVQTFSLCRSNLYVASLYQVREGADQRTGKQLAMVIGIGHQFFGFETAAADFPGASMLQGLQFGQCETIGL